MSVSVFWILRPCGLVCRQRGLKWNNVHKLTKSCNWFKKLKGGHTHTKTAQREPQISQSLQVPEQFAIICKIVPLDSVHHLNDIIMKLQIVGSWIVFPSSAQKGEEPPKPTYRSHLLISSLKSPHGHVSYVSSLWFWQLHPVEHCQNSEFCKQVIGL